MVAIILMVGFGKTMAQKGEMAVGGQLSYGSEIESLGIGAKFQYGITDAIRLEPSVNYFFGKNSSNMLDFNANLHYLFNVASKANVYPLVGLGYTSWGTNSGGRYWDAVEGVYVDDEEEEGSSSRSGKIAVNFGGGAEYRLTDRLTINAELKYQIISNLNQLVFGVGATYKF